MHLTDCLCCQRCAALWTALQEEVSDGVAALKAAPPPAASPRRSTVPKTTKTVFGLIHITGFEGP